MNWPLIAKALCLQNEAMQLKTGKFDKMQTLLNEKFKEVKELREQLQGTKAPVPAVDLDNWCNWGIESNQEPAAASAAIVVLLHIDQCLKGGRSVDPNNVARIIAKGATSAQIAAFCCEHPEVVFTKSR